MQASEGLCARSSSQGSGWKLPRSSSSSSSTRQARFIQNDFRTVSAQQKERATFAQFDVQDQVQSCPAGISHHVTPDWQAVTAKQRETPRFACKGFNTVHRIKSSIAVLNYLKISGEYRLSGVFLGGWSMGFRAVASGMSYLYFLSTAPSKAAAETQRRRSLSVLFVLASADKMPEKNTLEKVVPK
ncbi:hypothetical protein A6R68_12991, partial [Neotoma lepida]